ncbi:outer membrane protein assembly factor, partial [Odoribacter sp. OttesenSCG-928-A06]|nr:outer membrane protein assembly factor [Odoribacter sp. OttesenSCG-928-A06]
NFTLSFWGALKKEQYKGGLFNTRELGVEAKLITPQFWMPFFRMKDFRKNMAPKTSISMSYSSEVTPFYDREIANAKFGYLWRKADKKWRYNVDLVDLNYVLMNNVDTEFRDSLKNEYVKSAYKSHLIFSAVFTSVFTDQVSNVPGSYNYFRTNLETSGNLLWGASHLLNKTRKESDDGIFYHVLGVPYAQFVKSDAEYIFNHYVNYANTLVYRFYIGCGYPYGNMKVLPFEEAFFGGGANGIRAWHSRTLGPGSHVSNDRYPNSVGEFKLEANIEYRYKLFWLLEGALFLDAGNVWNITKYEDRKGTKLSSDFYKEIAVGTGVGLRLDANVFVLRFDWGIKVKDPAQAAGQRFVLVDNGKWLKNTVFNIAIGYPF